MKKLNFMAALAISALFITACGNNNNAGTSGSSDSSAALIPPPDNNSATNPSLADTAYSKIDSTKMKKDSARVKH